MKIINSLYNLFLISLFFSFSINISVHCQDLTQSVTEDPPEDPPEITYSGNEHGQFNILFSGETIGYENFSITGQPATYKSSSFTELTINKENPRTLESSDQEIEQPTPPSTSNTSVTYFINTELQFNEHFEPTSYKVTQEVGASQKRARVMFLPDRSYITYFSNDAQLDKKRIELKKDVMILDDNVFHHYLILAKRYNFSEGGIQKFLGFIPQQFIAGGISISDQGIENIEINNKNHDLQHLLVNVGDLEVNLWIDLNRKLKKLSLPKSEIEVIRN